MKTRTFLRHSIRQLQDRLRLLHERALARLLARYGEEHGHDVRERKGAEDEERVQEAHVLVRDAPRPEQRE